MKIEKFTNKILSSNSYIIYNDGEKEIWIIDPGDKYQLLNWIKLNNKTVKGILLTHSHIDHIYGVNAICSKFPELEIFTSEQALTGFYSSKANGSYYMEMPYVIEHKKINIVEDNCEIKLFGNKCKAIVLYTPGHNNDCISFIINENIFTGDAFIPGLKVHTKSKNSNKTSVIDSIKKIESHAKKSSIICPGHGDMIKFQDLSIEDLISKNNRINKILNDKIP